MPPFFCSSLGFTITVVALKTKASESSRGHLAQKRKLRRAPGATWRKNESFGELPGPPDAKRKLRKAPRCGGLVIGWVLVNKAPVRSVIKPALYTILKSIRSNAGVDKMSHKPCIVEQIWQV